ncbi:hypothetical protein [Melittangium boletus]|uniref:Uncharacterized protein n=1 Tax=Melittangium boletus DSM 14713 TaxID=1294270 RepID=A0A250IEH2_9BACT|nr:hypothetical protein [Melittangium boletus]ATB29638.1 hypothetical protein MEBOL_003093 [Melittangium boletus DSM 14713]
MLVLPLAVLLSATPPSLEGWSRRACPPPKQTPESNVELKVMEEQHAECLRKAMERALGKALLTLKKSRPAAVQQAVALQADYDRWVVEACSTLEEANWVDLTSGERSMGTGYGFTMSECRQRQYSWRGFYADIWARGHWSALDAVFRAQGGPAETTRQSLLDYRDRARRSAARAPAQAAVRASALPQRKLSREDWKTYLERLDRAIAGPEGLARRQCALLPTAPEDCTQRLADSLVAQLDFPEALRASSRHPPARSEP